VASNYMKNKDRLLKYRNRALWVLAWLVLAILAATVLAGFMFKRADAATKKAKEEKAKAEQATREADKSLLQAFAAQTEALTAKLAAELSKADAEEQKRLAKIASDDAVAKTRLADAAARKAQAAEKLEREANENAATTTRRANGLLASALARTPGRDFEALHLAVEAVVPELKKSASSPAAPIVKGLVDSVMAADDGVPLLDADGKAHLPGDVTYTQISPDARFVFTETFELGESTYRWGMWDAKTGKFLGWLFQYKEDNTPGRQGYFGRPKFVGSASFSRDGNRVAVNGDGCVRVWDTKEIQDAPRAGRADVRPIFVMTHERDTLLDEGVALDSTGSRVAVTRGVGDGRIFVIVKKLGAPGKCEPGARPCRVMKLEDHADTDETIDINFDFPYRSSIFYSNEDVLLAYGVHVESKNGPARRRFIYNSKTSSFASPTDPNGTNPMFFGVNNLGQIVGTDTAAAGFSEGFVYDINTGTWTTVSDPLAVHTAYGFGISGTTLNGINDLGQLVGFYADANGNVDGLLATAVPEPASFSVVGLVFAAGLLARRRLALRHRA